MFGQRQPVISARIYDKTRRNQHNGQGVTSKTFGGVKAGGLGIARCGGLSSRSCASVLTEVWHLPRFNDLCGFLSGLKYGAMQLDNWFAPWSYLGKDQTNPAPAGLITHFWARVAASPCWRLNVTRINPHAVVRSGVFTL